MARKSDTETTATENTEAGTAQTTEGTAAVAATGADDRFKKITHPQTGLEVNRKDYILELWANKMSRGAIAKHLSEITGKKAVYQVVFATDFSLLP